MMAVMEQPDVIANTKYQPTWDPGGPAVVCPMDVAAALNAAWDRMGVANRHRQVVLGQKRPLGEWKSFVLVVARGLAALGMAMPVTSRPVHPSGAGPACRHQRPVRANLAVGG